MFLAVEKKLCKEFGSKSKRYGLLRSNLMQQQFKGYG